MQPNLSPPAEPQPGLDYDFLRYIGVTSESQRRIQGFYLPFFQNCRKVIDLGCGDGDFVALLGEMGVEAVGVDSDPKAYQAAAAQGLPVVQQELLAYLHEQPANSVDGIFSAHVIEHIPYGAVIELIQEALRVLQPGGRLVLATPDPRTLFSHLEMYHLHFGHVSFFHPRLLGFFLHYAHFTNIEFGTNPETASVLLPEVSNILQRVRVNQSANTTASSTAVTYRREIPLQGKTFFHHLSYRIKRWLTHMLVQPLTDSLVTSLNETLLDNARNQNQVLSEDLHTLAHAVQTLNGPFECYAMGTKPSTTKNII